MNRVKILALLATVALLALVPVGLYAQQLDPPHRFFGTATMADGTLAPDDTVVGAWVGGAEVATAIVASGFQPGYYILDVSPAEGESFAGQMVTFTVAGVATDDSVAWVTRQTNLGDGADLNLVATGTMMEGGADLAIGLFELNSSGQTGRATLTQVGDDLEVFLSISSGALTTELAHIHSGQCGATLGGVDHALTSFVGGSGGSTTLLADVTLAMVQDGDHAINLHYAASGGTYTACGNIPATGEAQPLPDTGVALNMIAPEPALDIAGIRDGLTLDGQFIGFIARFGGKDGDDGRDGIKGDKGDQGSPGSAGADGRNGVDGANGSNGATGPRGPAGAAGTPGTTGPEGDSGGEGLAIVSLILAIVALLGVGGAFAMSRRS